MIHTHAKGQGQRSLGTKVIVEADRRTNGWTDGGDCITSPVLMRSVINRVLSGKFIDQTFCRLTFSSRFLSAVYNCIYCRSCIIKTTEAIPTKFCTLIKTTKYSLYSTATCCRPIWFRIGLSWSKLIKFSVQNVGKTRKRSRCWYSATCEPLDVAEVQNSTFPYLAGLSQ